ncbi:MAG: glycoside hydrolase family 26 protein [Solirubrobacteraceae bacterium]
MRGTLLSGLLVTAVIGLVALQVMTPWDAPDAPAAAPAPWPAAPGSAPPRLQLGVTTKALALNSYRPWQERDLVQVNAFERAARRHSDVVMWFADWAHVAGFDAKQAQAVAARGSVPEISWEPWDSRGGPSQPRYRLASIIAGDHDPYIQRWAREIAAYGKPVRLRFAHEMNGRWYPWAERANGNRPGEFAQAWRHVHRIFARARADNVDWVWSPVTGAVDRRLYPGSRQVDTLAVSGFIAGRGVFRRRFRSFAKAFGDSLTALHRLAPSKPVTLSEIGVGGSAAQKADWIRGMFDEIERRPYVRAVVWFDLRKEADWRVSTSPQSAGTFAAGLSAAG